MRLRLKIKGEKERKERKEKKVWWGRHHAPVSLIMRGIPSSVYFMHRGYFPMRRRIAIMIMLESAHGNVVDFSPGMEIR